MTKTLWIYFSGSRIFCLNAPKTRLKHFVFTATMIEKSLSPSENLTSALGLPKSIDSSWALEVGNFNHLIGTRPWAWERECRFWNLVFLIHFWLVLIWQNKKFFGHHVENSPVAPPPWKNYSVVHEPLTANDLLTIAVFTPSTFTAMCWSHGRRKNFFLWRPRVIFRDVGQKHFSRGSNGDILFYKTQN